MKSARKRVERKRQGGRRAHLFSKKFDTGTDRTVDARRRGTEPADIYMPTRICGARTDPPLYLETVRLLEFWDSPFAVGGVFFGKK